MENRQDLHSDGALLIVEIHNTGELYITRFGLRAKIRSATHNRKDPNNTGEQKFWPKVSLAPGPKIATSIKDGKGIPTNDIPLSCPYWFHLVQGLQYPEDGIAAAQINRNSKIDKTRCLIRAEENGRVTICRKGYRIELLPPF